MLKKLSKKTIERLWTASLIVICGILLILFASSLLGLELPLSVIRILGVIDLLAIPVLAWTTYRKWKHPSRKNASGRTKN